jgi:glycosyltransferase involved in cell wall biosynthesis
LFAWNVCLTHDSANGGLYRAVNDFALALSAPILSFEDGRISHNTRSEAPPVHRVCCGRNWLARKCHLIPRENARKGDELVAQADLLVVHSLFRGHTMWAAQNANAMSRQYWAVPHGCLDPWGLSQRRLMKRAWFKLYGQRYLDGAQRIIFSTQRELDKARPWIPADRAAVVHLPVALPSHEDGIQHRRLFRERLGVPDSARLLLYVGRLHSMKRPLETVQAFCEAQLSNCHLVVVGMDGDVTKGDLTRAVSSACANRIHILGPLAGNDLARAYHGSDCYISLSFRENFGYAAADALAYGMPVILSAGHDLAYEMPTLRSRFACGWLLTDERRITSVHAMREFAAAPSTVLTQASKAGRQWVAEKLSFPRFQSSLYRLTN